MVFNSSSTTELLKVFSFEEKLIIVLEYGALNVMIVQGWPYLNSGCMVLVLTKCSARPAGPHTSADLNPRKHIHRMYAQQLILICMIRQVYAAFLMLYFEIYYT